MHHMDAGLQIHSFAVISGRLPLTASVNSIDAQRLSADTAYAQRCAIYTYVHWPILCAHVICGRGLSVDVDKLAPFVSPGIFFNACRRYIQHACLLVNTVKTFLSSNRRLGIIARQTLQSGATLESSDSDCLHVFAECNLQQSLTAFKCLDIYCCDLIRNIKFGK